MELTPTRVSPYLVFVLILLGACIAVVAFAIGRSPLVGMVVMPEAHYDALVSEREALIASKAENGRIIDRMQVDCKNRLDTEEWRSNAALLERKATIDRLWRMLGERSLELRDAEAKLAAQRQP